MTPLAAAATSRLSCRMPRLHAEIKASGGHRCGYGSCSAGVTGDPDALRFETRPACLPEHHSGGHVRVADLATQREAPYWSTAIMPSETPLFAFGPGYQMDVRG